MSDRLKNFGLNVLIIYFLLSMYGTFHYLLPWHKPLTHPTFTEKLFGDRYCE